MLIINFVPAVYKGSSSELYLHRMESLRKTTTSARFKERNYIATETTYFKEKMYSLLLLKTGWKRLIRDSELGFKVWNSGKASPDKEDSLIERPSKARTGAPWELDCQWWCRYEINSGVRSNGRNTGFAARIFGLKRCTPKNRRGC